MSETPRTWVIEEALGGAAMVRGCPAHGEGPVEVGELEPLLDLLERLLRERDQNAAVAEELGEKLHHTHDDYSSYCYAMDACVSGDPDAEALLRAHGRLPDQEGGA